MTTDVNLSTAINQAGKTQQQTVGLAKDFGQFLQLLTTQLQHQDPLSPLDSNEFTNQLVQFSQVEQSINTNQKLDSLVQLQLSNGLSSALGYVGLDTNYISPEAYFDGVTPVSISASLSSPAKLAKLNVLNADGKVIYSKTLSPEAGKKTFQWDGSQDGLTAKVGKGTYTVRIDALDSDDKPIKTTTSVSGRVHGVESQNGQVFLLVGERAVPLGSVINAQVPEAAPTNTGATPETESQPSTEQPQSTT